MRQTKQEIQKSINQSIKETKDYFMRCCEKASDTIENRELIKKIEEHIYYDKDFRKDMMVLRDRILIGNYIIERCEEIEAESESEPASPIRGLRRKMEILDESI